MQQPHRRCLANLSSSIPKSTSYSTSHSPSSLSVPWTCLCCSHPQTALANLAASTTQQNNFHVTGSTLFFRSQSKSHLLTTHHSSIMYPQSWVILFMILLATRSYTVHGLPYCLYLLITMQTLKCKDSVCVYHRDWETTNEHLLNG